MAGKKAKMTAWRATQARLTLLYAQSDPQRLGTKSGRLAKFSDYEATLTALLADEDASPFGLPWEKNQWNTYWSWLVGSDYRESSVDALIQRVVPLRVKPSVDMAVPALQGTGLQVTALRTEGFVYPHASITAVTLELGGDATLAETADKITALAGVPVTVHGDETRLPMMAEKAASQVRQFCDFGATAPTAKKSRFRIFSVIDGTGGPEVPPANAAEWLAMQGISSLHSDWATFAPPAPDSILKLSWGTPKLAHFNKDAVTYILASNFTKPDKPKKSSNSCYHRNQVLLAAHLFALIPLVLWAKPHLLTRDMPVEADRLVPAAASTIVDLRGRDAYRSALAGPLAALLDPTNEAGAVAAAD
jgi:hypothetical protein